MLLDRHKAKIKTLEALVASVGREARGGARVVLCHGVFDVVHPGHIHHLLYAKAKADVLVCSVSADRQVKKGPYRPHTPQELRAANLAVFDIVDHVVICDEEKPLGLLAALQPDFYAKGFEYSATAGRAQPIAEVALVEGYGGQVLFTPGDLANSSSALIEAAPPDLRWSKLAMVMERGGTSFKDLREAVQQIKGKRVHVVGDTIVDALLRCEMIGANAKTPTISVRRDRRDLFVGGAAVVALHARAAGAEVQFSTVLGDDQPAQFVLDALVSAGVEPAPIIDQARATTVKEAVVVDEYRLLKIDTVDNRTVSDGVLWRLLEQVGGAASDAVVFSDFRHGMFNSRTIGPLSKAIPGGVLRAADSQVASRWGNICDFRGFDLITPNEREARHALGDQDSGVRALAARLYADAGVRWLALKLGARGALAFGPGGESFALDALAPGTAVDPVGAGDAFLAYATLALAVRPSLTVAAILGTIAAGLECSYDGNVPVSAQAVLARIDEIEVNCNNGA